MGQLIMLEPKHRPQMDIDIIGDMKKGISNLVGSIKKRINTETKTVERISVADKTLNAEVQMTSLYGKAISNTEIQSLKAQLYAYYRQHVIYNVDICKIYDTIQEDLVLVLVPYVIAFDGSSFEEILKMAMDLSRMASNPIIKGLDALPQLDNLLETDLIEVDSLGVQRTTLAILWSALILALFTKWTTICTSERNSIIKGGIALALSIGVEFVQFCHKSPESVTNYLRLLYESYNTVRDKYNQHHEYQIPDILKVQSPRKEFAQITGQERINTGQVLNMVYTFRVGDIALSILEKENKGFWVSDDICKIIITDILPIPNQDETNKIYRLYTEPHIYDIH